MREGVPPGELVEVPDKHKGLVIGKGGDSLNEISTVTGAKVIRKGGEIYIVSGTGEQRQRAKVHIRIKIVSTSVPFISLHCQDNLNSQHGFCGQLIRCKIEV